MRLIDADELEKKLQYVYSCDYIDSKSKEGIASDIIDEIDNAPTVDVMSFTNIICGECKFVNVARNRKPCCSCKWLERKSYYEGIDDV